MTVSSKVKSVVVISQLPPPLHGSTLMTKLLLETLDGQGIATNLVDRRFSRTVAEIGAFSSRKLMSAIAMPVRLAMTILRSRPAAVIFFTTNRPFSFLVDVGLMAILTVLRQKIIVYIHTNGYSALAERSGVWRSLVKYLLGGATVTVCLGESMVEDVEEWSSSPVAIIPNAVEPPLFVPKRESDYIIYFSNLIPDKGADTFLRVAEFVAREFPTLRFLVAGASSDPDFEAELRELASRDSLSGKVEFLGTIRAPEKKWELLASARLLIFPTRYAFEAQPLTILEAMSVGTPAVAFDVGGIRDVIFHGVNGLLIAAGDEVGMQEAVLSVLADDERLHDLENMARADYEERFSPASFREKWSQALSMVVA